MSEADAAARRLEARLGRRFLDVLQAFAAAEARRRAAALPARRAANGRTTPPSNSRRDLVARLDASDHVVGTQRTGGQVDGARRFPHAGYVVPGGVRRQKRQGSDPPSILALASRKATG